MNKINNQLLEKLDQQIYEDLTQLYKYFKQKTLLIYKLSIQIGINQDQSKQQKLTQLKNILIDEQNILDKYSQLKSYLIFFKMIFYRFFSRLIQIIQKQKKNTMAKNQNILKDYYNSIQMIILKAVSNKQPEYIQSMIQINDKIKKLVKISPTRPTSKIDKHDKNYKNENFIPQQKKQQKIHVTNLNLNLTSKLLKNSNNLISNYKTMSCICTPRTKIQIDCESKKKRSKVLQITSPFNHLECLDLQFQQYKYMISHIKNNMNQSNDEQIAKNYLISKEINNYAKSYMLYKARQIRKAKLHKYKSNRNSKDNIDLQNQESQVTNLSNMQSKQLKQEKEGLSQNHMQSQKIINLQSERMLDNYSKNSKLYFYSPKKISLCSNNISLMPQMHLENSKKLETSYQYRRKVKNLSSNTKKSNLNESYTIIVQGKKIQESQSKRLDNKSENQKISQSTLFI